MLTRNSVFKLVKDELVQFVIYSLSCLYHFHTIYLATLIALTIKLSEMSLVPRLTDDGGARVDGWCSEGASTIGSVRLFTLDLRQARAFHNTLARIQRVPRQGHLELRTLFNLNHLYNMLIHLQVRVDCRDECASFYFNATLKNIIHTQIGSCNQYF